MPTSSPAQARQRPKDDRPPVTTTSWSASAPGVSKPSALRHASGAERLGAFLLDAVVSFVLVSIVALIGTGLTAILGDVGGLLGGLLLIATYMVVVVLHPVLGEGWTGQTYGKHLMGIQVISSRDGSTIGLASAFARSLVRSVGFYALGIGVLWMLWDARSQGWHDKIVSSEVVKVSGDRRLDPVSYAQVVLRHDGSRS